MLENLPDTRTREHAENELKSRLGVDAWGSPIVAVTRTRTPDKPRPPGAPAWWVDDEEASQRFLSSMGVNLDG